MIPCGSIHRGERINVIETNDASSSDSKNFRVRGVCRARIFVKSKVIKLQKTLAVCEVMPDGKFLEINETATIQLKQQSGTSYGIYIKILNVIDRTIFKVRDEKCKEVFNGIAYSDLDIEIPSDLEKKKIIDILIPKRLLEPEITN